MGLHQGHSQHRSLSVFEAWRAVLAVALVVAVLGLLGEGVREALAFNRPVIAAGELWRLVSAHFVHLGASHLVLNLAGLGLVWFLVGHTLGARAWLVVWIASIIAVSAGLWVLEPQLLWYVGLSGVLHGLLAAGIIADFDNRAETWALALVLAGKLGWEQFIGPLPGSEAASGGTVIVNAHLYGAVGGVLAAILIRVRAKASI